MTAKYRIKQYQHLVESDDAVMTSCEEEIQKLESQIQDTDANLGEQIPSQSVCVQILMSLLDSINCLASRNCSCIPHGISIIVLFPVVLN